MFKRILVPLDGSPTSNKALVAALELARERGSLVRLVHSVDDYIYFTGYEYAGDVLKYTRGYGEKVLKDGSDIAASAGVPVEVRLLESRGQRLGDEIAEQAREFGADLVVVGTHGRRGVGRALLGSGAEQVIRVAPCPVLVVRSDAAEA